MNDVLKRKLVNYYKNQDAEYTLDDITFNDLNLDELFERMNRTSSSLGEEVLYSILRQPLYDIDELNSREEQIRLYCENNELRNKTQKSLRYLSKVKKYSIFEYLYCLNNVKQISFGGKFLALILILLCAAIIPFNVVAGVIALIVVFVINALRYFRLRDEISPYLICVSYVLKSISVGKNIDGTDPELYSKIKNIKNASFILGNISGATVHGGSGNPLDLVIDILKMGLHIDIIAFYHLLKEVQFNKDNIEKYLISLGTIDAYISIGIWRGENKDKWCLPVFKDNDSKPEIKACAHPLIDNPVTNDVSVNRGVLLTGSNASGKSTFLRSVALNVIMAQTVHTCFAKSYEAPLYKVITSMSISDNLLKGDSYYMAEVKALKRIMDIVSSEKKYNVMTFVDEVLRGTNTKERIASSTQILKYLSDNALSFAATHDIELTELLKEEYDNYHFSENVVGDDISFSYLIKEGPANSQNAIKLLLLMGFPNEIIDNAIKSITN